MAGYSSSLRIESPSDSSLPPRHPLVADSPLPPLRRIVSCRLSDTSSQAYGTVGFCPKTSRWLLVRRKTTAEYTLITVGACRDVNYIELVPYLIKDELLLLLELCEANLRKGLFREKSPVGPVRGIYIPPGGREISHRRSNSGKYLHRFDEPPSGRRSSEEIRRKRSASFLLAENSSSWRSPISKEIEGYDFNTADTPPSSASSTPPSSTPLSISTPPSSASSTPPVPPSLLEPGISPPVSPDPSALKPLPAYDALCNVLERANVKDPAVIAYAKGRLCSRLLHSLLLEYKDKVRTSPTWILPKGRMGKREAPLACAKRETLEETSVASGYRVIDEDGPPMFTETFKSFKGHTFNVGYWLTIFDEESKLSPISHLQSEIEEARWIHTDDIETQMTGPGLEVFKAALAYVSEKHKM